MDKQDLEREFERKFEDVRDNYRAICPFHDERSPSFLIHHTDLIGNCFGCGTSGSVEGLLAKYRGISVEEARKLLGITAGDRLAKARGKTNTHREPRYYPESWLAPWKEGVHKYVTGRGFDPAVIQAAGSRYDSAAKRQVFPHRNREGTLLGATGRACTGGQPKWYHYWGYDKGQALYSPFRTTALRPLLVVEGVFDLLWCYQNGVDNVVALLGAKATKAQRKELLQLASTLVIGLDNDDAGERGTRQLLGVLRESSRAYIINWPSGVHDWMDISQDEIKGVVDGCESAVQKTIRTHSRSSGRYASTKEGEVRTT